MLKLSYKSAQEKLTNVISEMEQSLIEYLKRADTPNYINIGNADIEAVDEEIYNDFKVEYVSYSEEDNCIVLSSYDNEDYGYFSDQNWNTIQQVYGAVELAIEKMNRK